MLNWHSVRQRCKQLFHIQTADRQQQSSSLTGAISSLLYSPCFRQDGWLSR
ncbi:hypothetical protein CE91St61_03030 [Lachnospiraceae bacterium]|nr:hypothetical protein CE91St61_03030 [Lachnospiraceae bacterium]